MKTLEEIKRGTTLSQYLGSSDTGGEYASTLTATATIITGASLATHHRQAHIHTFRTNKGTETIIIK